MASIKRNLSYNVLLNLSSVIFPLITAPYISRVLEPDGIGLFNFANMCAGYFALFAVLGIPTYGIREVAKKHDDKDGLSKLVSELISISFIATCIVTLVYVASILLIGQLNENHVIFLVSGLLLYCAHFALTGFILGSNNSNISLYVPLLSVPLASFVCSFLCGRSQICSFM